MDRYVTHDGLCFPLSDASVMVEGPSECPIESASITWATIEGSEAVTVEINVRGYSPLHLSVVEQEDGNLTIVLPEIQLDQRLVSD